MTNNNGPVQVTDQPDRRPASLVADAPAAGCGSAIRVRRARGHRTRGEAHHLAPRQDRRQLPLRQRPPRARRAWIVNSDRCGRRRVARRSARALDWPRHRSPRHLAARHWPAVASTLKSSGSESQTRIARISRIGRGQEPPWRARLRGHRRAAPRAKPALGKDAETPIAHGTSTASRPCAIGVSASFPSGPPAGAARALSA